MIQFAIIPIAIAIARYSRGTGRAYAPFSFGAPRRWVWALLAAVIAGLVAALDRSWIAALLTLPLLAVGLSAWLAQAAIVLGLPRAAWFLVRVGGGPGTLRERQTTPSFYAALALARRHRWKPADADFVERTTANGFELGTSGAAALALVAAVRGDVARSVAILRVIEAGAVDPAYAPALRLAREHVTVDALRRGDWRELAARDASLRPRLTWLLRAVARARLGEPGAPGPVGLWARWLVAPRRFHTFALVRGALGTAPADPASPPAPNLDAFVALLAREPTTVGADDVAAAALSLDRIRESPDWPARWSERASALGLSPETDARAAVVRDAIADLSQAILDGRWRVSWLPPGPTGDELRQRVADARFGTAEALVEELHRRTRTSRDLPEIDEWRAWADARSAIEELRRDGLSRQALFRRMNHPLTAYAVRLTNVRGRRVLAGNVFRLVSDLARDAGAVDAYPLADRNCAAVTSHSLPTGPTANGEAVGMPGRLVRQRRLGYVAAFLGVYIGPLWWVGQSFPHPALFVPLFVASAIAAALLARFVECWFSDDGLIVQSRRGRFVAMRGDVRAAGVGPAGIVWIRLQRRPSWAPGFVFTLAGSRAAAERAVTRLRAERGDPYFASSTSGDPWNS